MQETPPIVTLLVADVRRQGRSTGGPSRRACAPALAGAATAQAGARGLAQDGPGCQVVVLDGRVVGVEGVGEAGVRVECLGAGDGGLDVSGLGAASGSRGGVFAQLNSAGAPDAAVVDVPAGVAAAGPLHILYLSSPADGEAGTATSCPRCLIRLGDGARLEVVEEFAALGGTDEGSYFVNAVTEIELGVGAELRLTYVGDDAPRATHIKGTYVNQAEDSNFSLLEARVGGSLSRHELDIDQQGPATQTRMRHLLLAGDGQLHDLHSHLELAHVEGEADQLHKCIATHPSSRGVFDGSVNVGQQAQQTDAGQLTKNLLLSKGATVNAKPNLKIIADDVACTHGCTVAALDAEQIFYMKQRGISEEAANSTLVQAFSNEILMEIPFPALEKRVSGAVSQSLAGFVNAVTI